MQRTIVFLLSCVALAAAPQPASPGPGVVRSVYLFPMGHGLDQFLANHLASTGGFQVVTDPKLADTIMTDSIGQTFENRMKNLFPPEPEAALTPEPAPAKEGEKGQEQVQSEGPLQAMARVPPAGSMTSFGRGKGNVFLVDAASRQVIWSTFEKREGSSAEDLERAASRIVARLQNDMKVNGPKAAKHPRTAPPEPAPAPPAK